MSKLYFQGLSIDTGYSNYQGINSHQKSKKISTPMNSSKYNTTGYNSPHNLTITSPKAQTPYTTRGLYSMNQMEESNEPLNTISTINTQGNKKNLYRLDSPLNSPEITISKPMKTETNFVEIGDLLGNETKKPISLDVLDFNVINYEPSKFSSKIMGVVKAYGANTHQGTIRNYNEDRVSIIINMNRPSNFSKHLNWPKVSFFGIYDGHGGSACSEFLRDNLHKFICNDSSFPNNITDAIKHGFAMAEKEFITNYALNKNNQSLVTNRSGSCAVVLLIVENKCYVANVGDSRAILSMENGKKIKDITIDHKPNNPNEKKRIIENGGKVYQSQTPIPSMANQVLIGPYRVLPGRLSVSRTIGDVEAKRTAFGGLPNVIIPIPEIFIIDLLTNDVDFFILGCDGIFDQMSSKDVIDCAWMVFKDKNSKAENGKNTTEDEPNIHSSCGKAIDLILKAAMFRKSFDNVTSLIIMMKDIYEKKEKKLKIETDIINSNPSLNTFYVNKQNTPKLHSNTNKSQITPKLYTGRENPIITETDNRKNGFSFKVNERSVCQNNSQRNITGHSSNNPTINTSLSSNINTKKYEYNGGNKTNRTMIVNKTETNSYKNNLRTSGNYNGISFNTHVHVNQTNNSAVNINTSLNNHIQRGSLGSSTGRKGIRFGFQKNTIEPPLKVQNYRETNILSKTSNRLFTDRYSTTPNTAQGSTMYNYNTALSSNYNSTPITSRSTIRNLNSKIVPNRTSFRGFSSSNKPITHRPSSNIFSSNQPNNGYYYDRYNIKNFKL
ncbi:MAG: protein phosphatase 2C domain-containing protein [archaeon]|nr:protein phosphatase 2C domain-containing protein [archaeon]